MPNELENIGDGLGSVAETAKNAIETAITGIPAPIRKGAWKALNQLMSAAIEYPLATLQGAAEEKRAESKARVAIIEASARKISEQLRIPQPYIDAASLKFTKKIVREQINLDKISSIAAEQLKAEAADGHGEENEVPEPCNDWLNAFEAAARNMTSDQMQALFGKILAGEIRKPSSFSIKTIGVISQLDNKAAGIFRLLASMTFRRILPPGTIVDARVVGLGDAGSNTLARYGLPFDALNILQENGLIISDYNSYSDYRHAIITGDSPYLPLQYQDKFFVLEPKALKPVRSEFRVHGVSVTNTGRELLSVVDIVQTPGYSEALKAFFDDHGYILRQLT